MAQQARTQQNAVNTTTQTKLLSHFAKLGVDHDTAQKSTKIIKYTLDNESEFRDALLAARSGAKGAGGIALGAAVLAIGAANADGLGEVDKDLETGAKMTAFTLTELSWTMKMGKALSMTPNRAIAFIGVGAVQKALAVAGIVSDSEASKCNVAIARLGADVAVTALTWETGIGAVLGVASAITDAAVVKMECRL